MKGLMFLVIFVGIRQSFQICRTREKNVLLILTDDQDVELGSMQFMPKTRSLLQERGATFSGGFVSTPICCPSRTSILTGQYVHNHYVFTNNQNCSGTNWRNIYEKRSFGVHLQQNKYVTAYFGKYLNEYDGSYLPPGWDEWMGLVKNSRFYNYTVNFNGQKIKHGFDYGKDYFTDLIANDTIAFLNRHCKEQPTRPFLAVTSFPAPHGPEDPAPQYSHLFENVETHRTPSWNYAPNPDKQWILQRTGRMEPVHVVFTDLVQRRRLQTLQSVDYNIQRLYNTLRNVGLLSQTYIIYSSDHGYHLGQFGLVKGKNMPYEFDIRVPFFIRGPNLPRNVTIREPVMNVDIAPTILDMAGIATPSYMDGRSLIPLLKAYGTKKQAQDKAVVWRHTILIERGKMKKMKNLKEGLQKEEDAMAIIRSSCQRPEFSGPCDEHQEWKCVSTKNKWMVLKCHEKVNIFEECQCKNHDKQRQTNGKKKFESVGELKEVFKKNLKVFAEDSLLHRWRSEFIHYSKQKGLSTRKKRFYDFSTVLKSYEKPFGKNIAHDSRNERFYEAVQLANDTYLCDPILFTNYFRWRKDFEKRSLASKGLQSKKSTRKARNTPKKENGTGNCKCTAAHISSVQAEGRNEKYDNFGGSAEASMETTSQKGVNVFQTRLRSVSQNDTKLNCYVRQMNCFTHSADHWRTPPLWPAIYGEFCFCQNADNNTYSCLRTINDTHNFLYCEFITEFVSFYDLNTDPYQLTNTVWTVPIGLLEQLSEQLRKLRGCKGRKECEHYSSSSWDRPFRDAENDNSSV